MNTNGGQQPPQVYASGQQPDEEREDTAHGSYPDIIRASEAEISEWTNQSGTSSDSHPCDSVISQSYTERFMMGEHSSYHQAISGVEAERRLRKFGRHCYLTRFSDRNRCYVLSVYQNLEPVDTIKHFKITITSGQKYLIDGKDKEIFPTIKQLLKYYESHRIDPALRSIGQKCKERDYQRAELADIEESCLERQERDVPRQEVKIKEEASSRPSQKELKTEASRKIMSEHTSYHQVISGDEATQRLKSFGRHSYLTRYSKARESYMLTVFERRPPEYEVRHFKIVIQDDGKYRIEGKDLEFQNIGALLGHYEHNRIDPSFRTIGQNFTEAEYWRRKETCLLQ